MQIIGVNESHISSGVDGITANRDLPWLQDDEDIDAWSRWQANFRDAIVLNGDNEVVAVYNLTEHNLEEDANYEEFKAFLMQASPQ